MKTSILSALCALLPLAAPASETTGKILQVDLTDQSFELLKETEYDPKTDIGRSRFTCRWTDQTTFRKTEEKTSFAGIKGPVLAEFRGIDAASAKALAERKPFVARVATLMEDAPSSVKPGVSENLVIALFTPDAGENPRSGHITLDGTEVPVSLRQQNHRIFHHQTITPDELTKGFWQASLTTREQDGKLLVDRIDAIPLPDPRLTDDPRLPRVLVIGDSITMNYHEAAKASLKGIANYHRNDGNAFSSEHGVRNSELWLGNYREKGLHWDVIQFNHGLHDLKQSYDPKTDTFGSYAIPLDAYKANLEKQIAILRKTGAKLIWCTTTPVPNDNKSTYARRKGASAEFNAAALDVIRHHPDILVSDLHGLIDSSPIFDNWRKQDDVHFYQKEEQQILGKAVATTIRKALEKQ